MQDDILVLRTEVSLVSEINARNIMGNLPSKSLQNCENLP